MAYKHDDKSSGQLIRSADWNLMGHEIERLEIDKVNRAGDTIKGDLTVTGKAQLGSLAVTGDAGISGKVLGPLTVTGDASVSGKAQLGSLAVSGDASISGKAQLGSLAVTGNTSITSGILQIGSLQLSSFTDADQDEWPNVVWYRDTGGKNWDEGLIKHSSARGKFGRAGFGIHMNLAREFGLWSTGWDPLFAVEGGTGNAYFKGHLAVSSLSWGNGSILTPDQGGSIELGGNNATKGVGVPYIDFHFSGLTEDFNTRIINDGNKQLSIYGNLNVNGTFNVNSPSGNRLIMQGDGNLVIYRSNGTAWWNTGTNISDSRLKKDIRFIERPLEKLLSVNGISFSWAEEEWGSERELGVLADEIEKVFPELVCSLDKKYKSVKYQGLIAVLIEAIKEQQATIQQFGEEIQNLKGMLKLNPA